MIHRNWRDYQEALTAYIAAKAQHEFAVQCWNEELARFDKKSGAAERFTGCGCMAVIVAGIFVMLSDQEWGVGWLIAWSCLLGLYWKLDEKLRALQKRRFSEANPCPRFLWEEPKYEPAPGQSTPPPPKEPPPRTRLTLDSALSILRLARSATLDDLKRAYRDRVRDYHPDRVAHLGSELRDLAEEKTKEINAAYEYLRSSLGCRNRPSSDA